MGRRADRWRVRVAQAYGTAVRGATGELVGFTDDELLGALDIADTPGSLSGPDVRSRDFLVHELGRRTNPTQPAGAPHRGTTGRS